MIELFKDKVAELCNILKQPIDYNIKATKIKQLKDLFNICKGESLGEYYVKLLRGKEAGVVYTPDNIAKYLVGNTISSQYIISNPFAKIVDPSCGAGKILVQCFLVLKKIYEENLPEINEKSRLQLKVEDIPKHIIDNNLIGIDVDAFALHICTVDLYLASGYINTKNLIHKDFLLQDISLQADYYIGNPPYIGHKSMNSDYAGKLKAAYRNIYSDKGDLFFCFFFRALNFLKEDGKISFITSRYFMESPSGEALRSLLIQQCSIEKIIDFYGVRPFPKAGIDPVMLFIKKSVKAQGTVKVVKADNENKQQIYNYIEFNGKHPFDEGLEIFTIEQKELTRSPWILKNEVGRNIIRKIEKSCSYTLKDICISNQGIITGCDRAFIVNEQIINEKKLETDIIRPWIKSSSIYRTSSKREKLYILYTNDIDIIQKYPNIFDHIAPYKDKLLSRRECRKGVRRWYELQWGRNKNIFEGEKIIFPYKARCNNFVLDSGSYFSADIYSMSISKETVMNYEFLLFLLNSPIYEFYFKSFGKKLGGNLYEYYPNSVMELKVPLLPSAGTVYTEGYLEEIFKLTREEINIISKYKKEL
jgi:adenine-specific DNA-methyltransferase